MTQFTEPSGPVITSAPWYGAAAAAAAAPALPGGADNVWVPAGGYRRGRVGLTFFGFSAGTAAAPATATAAAAAPAAPPSFSFPSFSSPSPFHCIDQLNRPCVTSASSFARRASFMLFCCLMRR